MVVSGQAQPQASPALTVDSGFRQPLQAIPRARRTRCSLIHSTRYGRSQKTGRGDFPMAPGDLNAHRDHGSEGWLARRSDGHVWVANGTQGVWALPDSDAPPPRQPDIPGPGSIGPLLFDRDGAMWDRRARRRASGHEPRPSAADGRATANPN